MTPRAFWDQEGWLWEQNPSNPEMCRPLWSESGGWELHEYPTYVDRVAYFWGPLVPSA